MAFLLDPRWHTDLWVRRMSVHAKLAFVLFLTGQFRKRIPGLCYPVSPQLLAAAMGDEVTVTVAEEALNELVRPDRFGAEHVFYDPEHLVLQVPRAPAYNQADNGNILVAWYREWRETPECDLKWRHLASLRSGVNFGKESMVKTWNDTFREPEEAFARGERLKSYVSLAVKKRERPAKRRDPNGAHPATDPQDSEQTSLPLGLGNPKTPRKPSFDPRNEGSHPSAGAEFGSTGSRSEGSAPSDSGPPDPVTLVTRIGPARIAGAGTFPTPPGQTAPLGHLPATESGDRGGLAGGVAIRTENAPDGRPAAPVGLAGNGDPVGTPAAVRTYRLPPGVE